MLATTVGQAARFGDVDAMKKLVHEGHPLDVSDNRGWRATHEAADQNATDCLQMLLTYEETNVDWTCHTNCTALLLAAQAGHEESVRLLLDHAADPNIADHMGSTPLMEAVSAVSVDCVRLLLADRRTDVNKQQYCALSALHQAATGGSDDMVRLLVERDANVALREDNGLTAAFLAAQYGHVGCLDTILRKAERDGSIDVLVNIAAYDDATPLFLASQEGHTQCVALLLQHGADANIVTVPPKALALHAALEFNHPECVALLLPKTSLSQLSLCPSLCPSPPYMTAAAHPDGRCLRLLLDAGVSVNAPHHTDAYWSSSGLYGVPYDSLVSPLACVAAASDRSPSYVAATAALLAAGARPNVAVPSLPPLLAAVDSGDVAVARLLVAHGACVNVHHKAVPGVNILLLVCLRQPQLLNMLLLCGASPGHMISQRWNTMHSNKQGAGPALTRMLQFIGPVIPTSHLIPAFETNEQWERFNECAVRPRSLAQCCRLLVRRCFTSRQLVTGDVIRSLPLPNTIVDYLLYTELGPEELV